MEMIWRLTRMPSEKNEEGPFGDTCLMFKGATCHEPSHST
ncbi:hypothetical protein SLEP1_g48763 [Rubroshorea leprosula]|uniref:Uncharacterized protein n=1 Tax=Rubroshorea leprosula TaxID=152421 RepID=A0AAV5LXJ0_9ROSI|nr:hypothetical protein SLEP1_g48763 [Rubroshorea leprosula]